MVKDTWRQKKTQIIRNLEEMKGEAYKRKQFWLIKHSLDNITQEPYGCSGHHFLQLHICSSQYLELWKEDPLTNKSDQN